MKNLLKNIGHEDTWGAFLYRESPNITVESGKDVPAELKNLDPEDVKIIVEHEGLLKKGSPDKAANKALQRIIKATVRPSWTEEDIDGDFGSGTEEGLKDLQILLDEFLDVDAGAIVDKNNPAVGPMMKDLLIFCIQTKSTEELTGLSTEVVNEGGDETFGTIAEKFSWMYGETSEMRSDILNTLKPGDRKINVLNAFCKYIGTSYNELPKDHQEALSTLFSRDLSVAGGGSLSMMEWMTQSLEGRNALNEDSREQYDEALKGYVQNLFGYAYMNSTGDLKTAIKDYKYHNQKSPDKLKAIEAAGNLLKKSPEARIDAVKTFLRSQNHETPQEMREALNILKNAKKSPFIQQAFTDTLASLGSTESVEATAPKVRNTVEKMNQSQFSDIILNTQYQLGTRKAAVKQIFAQLYTKENKGFSSLPSDIQAQALSEMEIAGLF